MPADHDEQEGPERTPTESIPGGGTIGLLGQGDGKIEIAGLRRDANLSDLDRLQVIGARRLRRREAGTSDNQAEARGTVPPRSTDSRSSRQRCDQGAKRFAPAPLLQVALAPTWFPANHCARPRS